MHYKIYLLCPCGHKIIYKGNEKVKDKFLGEVKLSCEKCKKQQYFSLLIVPDGNKKSTK